MATVSPKEFFGAQAPATGATNAFDIFTAPTANPRIQNLQQKATRAKGEAERLASPGAAGEEVLRGLGEVTGFGPTGRRIAGAIAPAVVPEEEDLVAIVEQLIGGVTSQRRTQQLLDPDVAGEDVSEFVDIALDLPLASLGLSKAISTSFSRQLSTRGPQALTTLLDKPLTEFLPQPVRNVLQRDVFAPFKQARQYADEVIHDVRPATIAEQTKNYLSRKNVPENMGSSVSRLMEEQVTESPIARYLPEVKETASTGAIVTTKKTPIQMYDEFYAQELKFQKDIKEDTALSVVGERVGNAYDQVIEARRGAGEVMADEMKGEIGKIKFELNDTFEVFENELKANDLIYNAQTKTIKIGRSSKLTTDDQRLLESYILEFNRLGANPTAAEIDAFLSRTPKNIDIVKVKHNITKVTNGERMIKENLKKLRVKLSPASDPRFLDYFKAREDYAMLSSVLDEGAGFLGKKTQSGDFAKDASLVKSAIQSILNQGKKDWLLTLEDLTGYRAVDESILALQAMKDAGNFRGRSLLDIMTEGRSIPLSQRGLIERAIEKGIDVAQDKFVGTERDQTRRAILELMEQGTETVPSTFTPGQAGGEQAFGAFAGIEQDEDGNATFDPVKAGIGIAGVGMIKGNHRLPKEVVKILEPEVKAMKTMLGKLTSKNFIGSSGKLNLALVEEADELLSIFNSKEISPQDLQRANELMRFIKR